MFSPFRSPALRARRAPPSPRRADPPAGLGAGGTQSDGATPASAESTDAAQAAQPPREKPLHASRFQGGGGAFL